MGRIWTTEEDSLLLSLVNQIGKQWDVITEKIPNHTQSQIISRWEKYLNPNLVKGSFTKEEDEIIQEFVKKNGPQNWPNITQYLPHRSAKQCRERWFNHLSPDVSPCWWTPSEDEIIFKNYLKYGPKWALISKLMPGRSDNSIKNRWNSSIKKRICKNELGESYLLPDTSKRHYRTRLMKQKQMENASSPSSNQDSASSTPIGQTNFSPFTIQQAPPLINQNHFQQQQQQITTNSSTSSFMNQTNQQNSFFSFFPTPNSAPKVAPSVKEEQPIEKKQSEEAVQDLSFMNAMNIFKNDFFNPDNKFYDSNFLDSEFFFLQSNVN